jgi:uncharacterized protein YjbJ (UPF0337 family)
MKMDEVDGQYERLGETATAKWGKLTRAERTKLSGMRHSHKLKLYELYGIRDEDAENTIADVEQSSDELLPLHGHKT